MVCRGRDFWFLFFFKQKTAYVIGLGIPAEPLFRSHVFFCVSKNVSVSCAYTQGKREQFSGFNRTLDAINNVFRKFSAFHDETGRLNVDGMNIISNDGSNKLNRSRKARVDRKSGSAGMPRPISYAVFCLKKKNVVAQIFPLQVGSAEARTIAKGQKRRMPVSWVPRDQLEVMEFVTKTP